MHLCVHDLFNISWRTDLMSSQLALRLITTWFDKTIDLISRTDPNYEMLIQQNQALLRCNLTFLWTQQKQQIVFVCSIDEFFIAKHYHYHPPLSHQLVVVVMVAMVVIVGWRWLFSLQTVDPDNRKHAKLSMV